MTPGQGPDKYTNERTRLCSVLTEMGEPATDTHLADIILHDMTEEYRDVKLMTCKDPGFDLQTVMAVLHHFYLDGLSWNQTGRITRGDMVITSTLA